MSDQTRQGQRAASSRRQFFALAGGATAALSACGDQPQVAKEEVPGLEPAVTSELLNLQKDFGAVGDGSADDTDAVNSAVAHLNANPRSGLYVPPGIHQTTGEPPAIQQDDVSIVGDGPGTSVIRFASSAGGNGTFFTLGTDSILVARPAIEGLRLQCLNSPDPDKPAFQVKNANDLRVDRVQVEGVSALCKVGGDLTACARTWFRNVSGSYNAGRGGKVIWLHNVKNFKGIDVHVTGKGVPSGTGASIYAAGVAGGSFLDTADFVRCRVWAAGQPYGVCLDATEQKIAHYFFADCVFDDCAGDAFRIVSTGKEVRNVLVRGTLLGATNAPGSNCVDIAHSGTRGTADVLTGVTFEDCLMAYRGGKAVVVEGPTVEDLSFRFNRVQDSAGIPKTTAFSFAAGNWQAIGNRFYRFAGAGNTRFAIETTADVDDFQAIGNHGRNLGEGFFNHFSYTRESDNRIVESNIPNS